MLEKVNLKKRMMKEEFKQEAGPLKAKLQVLQQRIKESALPVIVLFDGWGAAGKGSFISDIILNLDPRSFKVYSCAAASGEERRKPLLWRYWLMTPQQGNFSILDRSWYQEVSLARVEEKLSDAENRARMDSIRTFERQLTDDGTLLIKFFLHIDQKEQKKRLERLAENGTTAWRVTEQDRKRNKNYERYYKAFDEMLAYTDTPNAPWHVVASTERNSALAEVYHVLVESVEEAIRHKAEGAAQAPLPAGAPVALSSRFTLVDMPRLSDINLQKTIDPEKYKDMLGREQKTLRELHNRLYLKKVPVVVVYEGWDAAGKGGNIRRVAAALDPRGYEAIPIAAPDKYELAHHYLWRFWSRLPKTGHIAIFDRSWYGRVMVERIEGFCSSEQWHRAYNEINEFEKELYDWGAIVVKFWLHIDQEEQLRRFNDRQNTPEKQWKITDEDWRNRAKWPQYEEAVNDMLKYTSTDFAPWIIVESNDKKFARLKAISALIDAIRNRLDS